MRALYLTGAVLLTLVWLLARSFAPAGGLTRSYYYPLPRDANPRALETRMLPVVEEPAAGVDLAFLEELHRPVRDYFVRWRGVWFLPRQERIDFRAGADDGVIVRIDGEVVLERHPAVGMHTAMRSVALEAGAHALQIDHWQRGAARRLNVQSSPVGGEPEPIRPGRLFPADPGALGYWLRVAAVQLAWPVLLVWAAGPATWLGRKVWRGAAALTAPVGRRTVSLSHTVAIAFKRSTGLSATQALHIFAFTSLAVAHPLFQVVSREPPFFVARNTTMFDLVGLIGIVCLALPTLLLGIEVAFTRFGATAASIAHSLVLTALGGVLLMPILKRTEALGAVQSIGLALLIAGVAALSYGRFGGV